jgi:hypothetical protein
MKHVSSKLIVFALIAALARVTSSQAQAAETPQQDIQDSGASVRTPGNDVLTGIRVGIRTNLALDSTLRSYNAALLNGAAGSRSQPQNVALAANGAVAAASSTGIGDGPPSSVNNLIDDTRSGANSYWTDDTVDEFPDVVQITFFGNKTIDRIVVYSVQDNYFDGVDPTDTDACTVYGLVNFTVEGWNGREWVTLGDVTDNLLCKRTVSFSPFTTDHIRINVTTTGGWSWTRIAEVEAWEVE